MSDTISINGVEFTPLPKDKMFTWVDKELVPVRYKYDYVQIFKDIHDPSCWTKKYSNVPANVTQADVERAMYRELILNDLFFIVYFVMGVKIANHPFIIWKCQDEENRTNRRTLDIHARAHFKAIDVNEPVPTLDGWKNHGDLIPGDYVFGQDGNPIRVVATTEVFENADCYRVTFGNGYSLVASGSHLWRVERKIGKRRVSEVLTTEQLSSVPMKRGKTHPSPTCAVKFHNGIICQSSDLKIDPYLLGYWLGNGTSSSSCITAHDDDAHEVANYISCAGHIVRIEKYESKKKSKASTIKIDTGIGNPRVLNALRDMNQINNKHIPLEYLRGSFDQRLSLLQGLMDSDGFLHSCGTAYYTSINENLANGVAELVTSLGMRASISHVTVKIKILNYVPYQYYRVTFQPIKEIPAFRLKRKREKIKYSKDKIGRWDYHYIQSVEKVESIPVSCIQVDATDGMYLVGKHMIPTHNSTIKTVAKTVQYHLKNPEECTCIFSYKRPAAEDFLDSIRLTYEKPIIKFAFPDVVYERPAVEAHSWSLQNGIVLRRKNTSRKEATVEASGIVEGMAMGKHFERRVYDDALETADIADSPDELNKAYSRFEMSAYLGMGLDSDFEEVIGTFYTQNGPYVRLKEKVDASGNPFYHAKIIPGSHNGLREGIPIFLSQQKFDDEKTKIHFDAQILCDPTPKDKRKLNPEFLNEIEPVLIPKNLVKVMLVDPAGDDKGKGGCDWAYMVVGIQPKLDELGLSNVYILHANIEELQEAEAPELIARMYISSGMIKAIGVEKVAQSTTEIHIANILKQHGRRISTEDGSLIILSPKGRQKDRRIVDNLAWPLNNGKVHISKAVPSRVRDRFKEEFTKFPYWKKDGTDCLSYTWDMIKEIDFSFYEDDTSYNYNPVGFTRKTGVA